MSAKTKVKYPVALQWKIPRAKLQELRNSTKECLKSAVFTITGTDVQYYVDIYPNGDSDEHRGQAWIFVHFSFRSKKEIKAEYTVSVESANVSQKFVHEFTQSAARGGCFGTTDMLFDFRNSFIVDGQMVIKVVGLLNIEMDAPIKLLVLGNSGIKLCMDLWKQDNKDFTIVADGKEVKTHKCVLAARSPVFAAMFQPHTKEAQENKVVIPDFSFNVAETAIKFCYDAKLVENVSLDDQISLLQFFDKYDIEELKIDLEKHLIPQVNVFNVCQLANCSIISNAPNQKKKCGELLQRCFRDHELVPDFDILDKDFIAEVLKNALFKLSV